VSSYHEICPKCEDETITHGWSPSTCPFCKINQLERELAEVDQKWERRLIAALGGHADSKLWGDDGLIAATWRCVEGYEKMEKELADARKHLDAVRTIVKKCANHQLSAEMDDFAIEHADWQKFYGDNIKKLRALLKG
jgi:hypothetical protein